MQTTLSRLDAAIEHARQELSKAIPVIEQFRDDYMAITVTGPDDDDGYHTARVAYDRVKRCRIDTEKTRKTLKADALKYNRVIDGEARQIKELIEPIETHLKEQVDIVRLEKARREADGQRRRDEQIREWVQKLSSVGATVDLDALKLMDEHEFHFHFKTAEKKWQEAEQQRQEEQASLDAERAELDAERAELEQLRKEQRERQEAEERKKREVEEVERAELKRIQEEERKAEEARRNEELKPVRLRLSELATRVTSMGYSGFLEGYTDQINEILEEAAERIRGLV